MFISSRLSRVWGRRRLVVIAIAALALTGCGDIAENLVQEGVEQAIENDAGGDVDLDFNGEDGFSIQTEEGSMTVDGDGNFVIEGADGETMTGEANEDGFTVTNEDGTEVFEATGSDGEFAAESEDGSFTAGPGMPEGWPSAVPQPPDLTELNGSSITTEGELLVTATGTTSGDVVEYFDDYGSDLEGNGFERTSYFEGEGFRNGTYQGSGFLVSTFADGGSSTFTVSILNDPEG